MFAMTLPFQPLPKQNDGQARERRQRLYQELAREHDRLEINQCGAQIVDQQILVHESKLPAHLFAMLYHFCSFSFLLHILSLAFEE